MDEPMNFALVGEDGVVTNIIWLCSANIDDFARAICVANLPVEIGDRYENSVFLRDGEEVLSYPE